MNVVREQRNTITHLEAELEKKEQQFTKQKQRYEEIIQQLQKENERLKQLLQGDSITHHDETFKYSSHDQSQTNKMHKEQEYAELENENSYLKQEISELSTTYQKQIDQITFYFEKIKSENKRLLPMQAHYVGQLNYLKSEYHALVKDNQTEQ